ncbi:MAG TPA: hydroxymethylbilane synthase [Bacteroidota bacterium]|nr:hydroxymethylbilane synthase [Bacteroidota bacterium]
MKRKTLTIGSRGSDLALWQARWVESRLRALHPSLDVRIEIIKTKGDKILDSPLSKIGDKGLFTREIEAALLAGHIDAAVHSLKDLPTELPPGLTIGAICEREDVRDVFIPHPNNSVRTLAKQAPGAHIATGSLRRKCQLLAFRSDLVVIDIRGNLNTRMKKLAESDWAGMILARAGVMRLGWESQIGETLPPEVILPAVGQGALGIEIRSGDKAAADLLAGLIHQPTADATCAERALLRRLEGGCQVPIGTYGRIAADVSGVSVLHLDAMVGSLDGKHVIRGKIHGGPEEAERLGTSLAETLLSGGAERILREIRAMTPQHEPA